MNRWLNPELVGTASSSEGDAHGAVLQAIARAQNGSPLAADAGDTAGFSQRRRQSARRTGAHRQASANGTRPPARSSRWVLLIAIFLLAALMSTGAVMGLAIARDPDAVQRWLASLAQFAERLPLSRGAEDDAGSTPAAGSRGPQGLVATPSSGAARIAAPIASPAAPTVTPPVTAPVTSPGENHANTDAVADPAEASELEALRRSNREMRERLARIEAALAAGASAADAQRPLKGQDS